MSLLLEGEIEIQGRMPWSSNGTYLVTVCGEEPGSGEGGGAGRREGGEAGRGAGVLPAIYKPGRAERPLWDFPDGLFRREVAAYELAEALGWGFVPETVVRLDAPLGAGSLQRFVEADFEQHYFTLVEDEAYRPALKRMAVFDYVANNADRKGGHCLLGRDGRLWGIDHGLCFHELPKLRTVIWDFAGEPISGDDLSDLARLAGGGLPRPLTALLHDEECRALETRIAALLRHRRLPEPRTDRPYPWPLV